MTIKFAAALIAGALALPAAPLHAGQVQGTVTFLDATVSNFFAPGAPYLADLEVTFTGDDSIVSTVIAGFPGQSGIALTSLLLTVRPDAGPAFASALQTIAAGTGFILTDSGAPILSVVLELPDGDPEPDLLGAVDASGAFPPGFLFDQDGTSAATTGVLNAHLIGETLPFIFPGILAVNLVAWGETPGSVPPYVADASGPAAFTFEAADVPLPAAAPLLIAGLGGLLALGRRRRG